MSKKYIDWRNAVFMRDKYTCQKCRLKPKWVEAHHIRSFSEMLTRVIKNSNGNDTITEVMNDSEFWDITNGVTLCKKCHSLESGREHNTYYVDKERKDDNEEE